MHASTASPSDTAASAGAASMVPAVKRALTLLNRLALQREPMSLARLSADLALPKSSVHGLCNTLLNFDYLRREADGGFTIGPAVMRLAEAFAVSTDVTREFNALWVHAGAAPDETVVLSVLNGADALYVAVRNSARPLGLAFTVGMRLPAYLSGSGKAMLAMREPEEVKALFAQGLSTRLTPYGPGSLDDLMDELALTRRRGYSIDEESVREGVYAFGAPVFDAAGQAVAAISVCFNKAMLGDDQGERHRDVALQVARTLSQRLGGEVPSTTAATSPHPGTT